VKKKKIFLILGVLILVGGGIGGIIGYRMWNTPHRDITSEEANFKADVAALAAEFASGGPAADKKYSEKVVEFTGEVAKITPGDSLTSVQIKGTEAYGLMCEMLPEHKDLTGKAEVGKPVKIKAFYKGYIEGDADMGMSGDILFKKGVVVQ
jgi:hypothetical protein